MEIHGRVRHAQRQECREEEVGHGQVEEPNRVDRLLHLEASHPDNHAVAQHAEDEGEAVNDEGHGVEGLPQLRVLVLVVLVVFVQSVIVVCGICSIDA